LATAEVRVRVLLSRVLNRTEPNIGNPIPLAIFTADFVRLEPRLWKLPTMSINQVEEHQQGRSHRADPKWITVSKERRGPYLLEERLIEADLTTFWVYRGSP
jgi:hypothetical protein